MDVPASPAALPEVHACLGAFQVRFRRPEGREAQERDTTGRLTELPNKHGDPIAQAVPGTRAQRLQEVLTNMPARPGVASPSLTREGCSRRHPRSAGSSPPRAGWPRSCSRGAAASPAPPLPFPTRPVPRPAAGSPTPSAAAGPLPSRGRR
jgi:hypothetical protein